MLFSTKLLDRIGIPLKRLRDRGWKRDAAGCLLSGTYHTRLVGVDGEPVRDWIEFPNGATYEGMNYLLDCGFRGQSQLSSWFFVPINGSGYSAVSVNDTAASHSGWTEFTTYSESTRQQWSPAAASSGTVINTAVTLTISSSGTIQGFGLQSNSTKSSTSGKLASTATLSSADSVTSSQTYQVVYEVDLTPVA